jgi:hypothetical protein
VPTKLEVYNGALQTHLNCRPLRTLSDARTERRALDAVWTPVLKWMLEQGMWNFALRTQRWEASTTVIPEFGHRSAFAKPADYVRLSRISDNEYLEPTLSNYLEEGDYFICDIDVIFAQFVSNDLNFGADPNKWTPAFAAAFKGELAYEARGGIGNLSTIDVNELKKAKRRLMQDAQSKDVVNQAPSKLPQGRLVSARAGFGRGNNAMRRTPYA